MPSPVAHGSLVFLVRAFAARHQAVRRAVGARPLFLSAAALAALWAPDIDFGLRLLSANLAFAHGGATHSLAAGVVFGLIVAAACRWWYGRRLPLLPVLAVGTACAWAHALMDMATAGDGVMLLWPMSEQQFTTIPVFVGARHSQPLAWRLHLVTLFTELLFVVPIWWAARRLSRGASSI
jgi:membrane-bound metal-dependent hydrolase YbcI (DUF457 family)